MTHNKVVLSLSLWIFCVGPVLTASGQNISFAAPQSISIFYNAVIGDINSDGWLEPFGSLNDTHGNLAPFPIRPPFSDSFSSMGLPNCKTPFDPAGCLAITLSTGNRPNDLRLADLNGDGCPDLVVQGYSDTSDDTRALLYLNDGTGHFQQDPVFPSLDIRGRGEGVVVADFNNDGYLDIFLPYYTCSGCGGATQAYLFLNDGHGHFREVAKEANLDFALGSSIAPYGMQPEGTQAADVNNDGLIDLYVGGRLMINTGIDSNGVPQFQNLCTLNASCGLPDLTVLNSDQKPFAGHPDILGNRADEGFKFLDWNNDGLLDLAWLDWRYGPILFQNIGTATNPSFAEQTTRTDGKGPFFSTGSPNYQSLEFQDTFQIQAYDLDNDGLEDVITAASPTPDRNTCRSPEDPNFLKNPCPQLNAVFRNVGVGYEKILPTNISGLSQAEDVAFGDFNRDGRIDIIYQVGTLSYFKNTTVNSNGFLSIEMLGPNGERNQFGRVIQASPVISPPYPIYTRVVDGGSGERSQNQYAVLIGTPYASSHAVSAYYPKSGGGTAVVSFRMQPGQYAQVFAPSAQHPSGQVKFYVPPNFPPPPAHGTCVPWAPGTPSGTLFVQMYGSNGFSYLGTDGNVWWTWNNSSASTASGWKVTNLTASAGAPTAASGSTLLGYTDPVSSNGNTYYVGSDQHIHLLAYNGTSEVNVDVTAATGGQSNAFAGTPFVRMYSSNGFSYLGTDGNVWWTWNNSSATTVSGWKVMNLTKNAGAPTAATGSTLLGYTDPVSGNGNTYYVGSDQHVHVLAYNGTSAVNVDITAVTTGPNAVAGTPFVRMYGSNGFSYLGTDGNVWWTWNNSSASTASGWKVTNLTVNAGAPIAATGSTLLGYTDPVSGNGNTYYVGSDQHIHLLAYNGTSEVNVDVTAATGGPNAVAGTPFVQMYGSNGFSYLGTDGNVWWTWNNSSATTVSGWKLTNLTKNAGAPFAITGSTLLGYTDPVSGNGNTYYVGSDQHVHVLAYNGTTEINVDITAATSGPNVP
jgi:hypothetical protein